MCNPVVAQFGFSAATSIGGFMSERQAVNARNRARLLNFREENKRYYQHKEVIESAVITYLKENNLYEEILNESREIPEVNTDDKLFCTCFGVDVFERDGELVSEFEYAQTL